MTLTPKQRKELKAQAHHLNPVVRIGQKGMTENVVNETDQALAAHELIKVHIAMDDRDERHAAAQQLAGQCRAEVVTSIGKVAVLYRRNDDA